MTVKDLLDSIAGDAISDRPLPARDLVVRAQDRARRRHAATRRRQAGALLAAVAAVLLLLMVAPSARSIAPAPARVPPGPGALPSTLYVPPPWTPSVAERPISRAAYLLEVWGDDDDPAAADPVDAPVVVGADGGEYRTVPAARDWGYTLLSRDGRRLVGVAREEEGADARGDVLTWVDLATGRTSALRLAGLWGAGYDIDGVALTSDGRRVAVWGSDQTSKSFGRPGSLLVDLDAGRIERLCSCSTPLAFTADGRLLAERSEVGDEIPPGAAEMPPDPLPEEGALERTQDLDLWVSPDGSQRSVLGYVAPPENARSNSDDDGAEPWTLAVSRRDGRPRQISLGDVRHVRQLAETTGGPVLAIWEKTDEVRSSGGSPGTGRGRIELVGAPGRSQLGTAEPYVWVEQVAAGVVDGGRIVPGVRPEFGAEEPAWWAWQVRRALPWVLLIGIIAGILFAVRVDIRPVLPAEPGRPVPSPGTSKDTLRPANRRRRLTWQATRRWSGIAALSLAALMGIGGVVAPSVVTPRWEATAPRPEPGAPPLVPEEIWDVHIPPRPVFERAGMPRTRALTILFRARVAGRDGLYGADAVTGRTVAIEGVPGVGEDWLHGTQALLGRDGTRIGLRAGQELLLIDLGAARVESLQGGGTGRWSDVGEEGLQNRLWSYEGTVEVRDLVAAPDVLEEAAQVAALDEEPWWTILGARWVRPAGIAVSVAVGAAVLILAWLGRIRRAAGGVSSAVSRLRREPTGPS